MLSDAPLKYYQNSIYLNAIIQFIFYGYGEKIIMSSQRGASDSVTDFSVLSNLSDAQNVSCLGLCGRYISPKSSA